MRIVIAPDSFKGSLRSPAVAEAMAAGAGRVFPAALVEQVPVGDGGEGTLDALLAAMGGATEVVEAADPLGRPRPARLGLLGDGETAFVEMAEASGLSCLAESERDPRRATSFGTGQLLAAAFRSGRRRVIVGLGGSATNDGGTGMLTALGARFLDGKGRPLAPGGEALAGLERIDLSGFFRPPGGVDLVVASDVTNPLCGPDGATAVYGPQKGAGGDDVRVLDAALARFADIAAATLGSDLRESPGAGAAGGLGFALLGFTGARIERGVERVLDLVGLQARLAGADLALTGEGRIDRQTFAFGKTVAGVGQRCRAAGVPCIAFGGGIADDAENPAGSGVVAILDVTPRPMSLAEAAADAPARIATGVERGLRLYAMGLAAGAGSPESESVGA